MESNYKMDKVTVFHRQTQLRQKEMNETVLDHFVQNQQELVDNIDDNISNSIVNVLVGLHQVEKANRASTSKNAPKHIKNKGRQMQSKLNEDFLYNQHSINHIKNDMKEVAWDLMEVGNSLLVAPVIKAMVKCTRPELTTYDFIH
eukprot:2324361-Ditylum_brightwellii.AAC.1